MGELDPHRRIAGEGPLGTGDHAGQIDLERVACALAGKHQPQPPPLHARHQAPGAARTARCRLGRGEFGGERARRPRALAVAAQHGDDARIDRRQATGRLRRRRRIEQGEGGEDGLVLHRAQAEHAVDDAGLGLEDAAHALQLGLGEPDRGRQAEDQRCGDPAQMGTQHAHRPRQRRCATNSSGASTLWLRWICRRTRRVSSSAGVSS